MVRVDHLSLYNNTAKITPLDEYFRNVGGTIFGRCYTPSPDTPRSWACVQTGLLPSFNGCDTRIKWPRYFINEGLSTIWDHAAEKGFKVNLCCNKHAIETGMFRFKESESIKITDSVEDFIQCDFSDNSISCIGNQDLHWAVNDFCATEYGLKKGFSVIGDYFTKFINEVFISQFDYVFYYSDHGLAMENERIRYKSSLDLLNDGRNQLLMFCHRKGDDSIQYDNRLASNLDLFSTLEELIGGEDMRQGYSLLEEKKRTITHIEDHSVFSVRPDIMLSIWRVISDDFDIRTDTRVFINKDGSPASPTLIEDYLYEFSPTYAYLKKSNQILKYYKELSSPQPRYFEGSRRINKRLAFIIKAFYKIRRILLSKLLNIM